MSTEDVLIRGQVVEAHDPPSDEGDGGYGALARGFGYLGQAVFLFGPFKAVLDAGSDLGSLDPSTAVVYMAVGLVIVAAAGLVSVLTSRPVAQIATAVSDRLGGDPEAETPDPLDVEETGGDPETSDSEQGVDPLNVEADPDD